MAYKMNDKTSNGTVTKSGVTKGINYALNKIKESFKPTEFYGKKTGKEKPLTLFEKRKRKKEFQKKFRK